MASTRSTLRLFQSAPLRSFTQRQAPLFRQRAQRRAQSTATDATTPQNAFQRLMNSPIGPKTVHFWAPIMKWGLVIAGIADFARPVESLSLTQNLALVCTGAIWTRWCFVIKPKNLFLAAVNFFLFLVGTTQVTRVLLYQQSLKKESMVDELKDAAHQVEGEIEKAVGRKDVNAEKGAMKGKLS